MKVAYELLAKAHIELEKASNKPKTAEKPTEKPPKMKITTIIDNNLPISEEDDKHMKGKDKSLWHVSGVKDMKEVYDNLGTNEHLKETLHNHGRDFKHSRK